MVENTWNGYVALAMNGKETSVLYIINIMT
jgi:hypothetical protein